MKQIILSCIFVMGLVLSSCSINQYTARQVNVVRHDIHALPTIVDVEPNYSRRIEVTSKWCRTQDEAINECKYRAIAEHEIDVVVDPMFMVENNKNRGSKQYRASLMGYAGYYVNSRTLYEDIEKMKEFSREDIEKYLIMHKPEVLKYMHSQSGVIIYHNDSDTQKKEEKVAPAEKKSSASESASKKHGK